MNNEQFAVAKTNIDIKRSRFDRSSQLKTSLNAGELVPILVDEVLPGDTFKMDTASVIRMSTPIFPVMDNCYADFYFFFVPNRLTWEHWKEFNGENTQTHWEQTTEYEIPQITAPVAGWNTNTIADYMGIPIKKGGLSVTHLPFRAYNLIWNEWFRDQNLQDPAYFNKDETTINGTNGENYITDAQTGGKCLPVNKFHDYFTSCLPAPQKGPAVLLPIGDKANIVSELYGDKTNTILDKRIPIDRTKYQYNPTFRDTTQAYTNNATLEISGSVLAANTTAQGGTKTQIFPDNTYADLRNVYADLTSATASTINELRQAFQIQRLFERDARGGTRYTEIIRSHFGVTSPDARQQRPEYLGGKRIPINISQVTQTAPSNATTIDSTGKTVAGSPQGNTAAFSLTGDRHEHFTKSFTEHGYIIGLLCIRQEHTYQQGIERMWSRKRRFDFYYPALANIGEQPVLNKEIFAQGTAKDNETFGFQEAWADYRYKPSRTSGEMRSTADQSLHFWHYGDNYNKLPMLNGDWIKEDKAMIDRTLAVSSADSNQFIADIYFKNICTRPMPLFSVPGLIDHN